MAEQDQLFTVAADLGSTPQQLDKLKSLFTEQASAIEKFINITAKLNADSKKLEVTFEGITAAFEKVNAVLAVGPKGGVDGLQKLLKISEQVITAQEALRRQAEQNAKIAAVVPAPAGTASGGPAPVDPRAAASVDQVRAATDALTASRGQLTAAEAAFNAQLGLVIAGLNTKAKVLADVNAATQALTKSRGDLTAAEGRFLDALNQVNAGLQAKSAALELVRVNSVQLANGISAAVVPALKDVKTNLQEAATQARAYDKAVKSITETPAPKAPPPPVAPSDPKAASSVNEVRVATEALTAARAQLTSAEVAFNAQLVIVVAGLNSKSKALGSVITGTNLLTTARGQLTAAETAFNAVLLQVIANLNAKVGALSAVVAATSALNGAVGTSLGSLQNQRTLLQQSANALSNYAAQVNALNAATTGLAGGVQIVNVADGTLVTSLGQVLGAINSVEAATRALAATDRSGAEEAERSARRRSNATKNARKDVDLAVQTELGTIPKSASASELSALEAAMQRLAKAASQGALEGGRLNVIADVLKNAGKEAIETSDKLSKIKTAALELKNAYDNLGEAARKAQEKADAAAAKKAAKATADADAIKAEAATKKAAADAAASTAERDRDARTIGSFARTTFTPALPAGTEVPAETLARLEAPIRRLEAAIRAGRVELGPLNNALLELATTGNTAFTGLDARTVGWIRSMLLARNALVDLGRGDGLAPLVQRSLQAQQVFERFRTIFSSSLRAEGVSTGPIDAAIEKLSLMARTGQTTRDRIDEVFAALQRPGGLNNLTGEITAADRQVARLVTRIQQLHDTAVSGASAARAKQQQYNDTMAQARPVVDGLVGQLQRQFGQLSNPQQVLQAQTQLNSLYGALARGKFTVADLQTAWANLNATIASGGKTPPPILPPGGAANAQAQLLRLIDLFKQVDGAGNKTGKSLLLTWESVFRIFQVQVLHQFIGSLIGQLQQATSEIQKFQIKISEIRTISQDSQLSFGKFSDEVRKLSDAFGLPLLDVAKATYDAISNQVAKGAKAIEFMRQALEFARVTVSSATDAVNLLSSVLNSYGQNAVSAERASAVLFKVIDLGRVTASEMSNTFGRVAVLASQAGVSLEELGASIATLTVRGTKYSEAYTLINNVLLKLIKPTDEMKKLMREWGVDSGEAAIQTFGFVGVLRKLQQELDKGGVARLGEIEKDMRAIRGALGLVSGDAFADFEDNLKKITTAADNYHKAVEIINESPGIKVQKQLNAIQNFFTVDFGSAFLREVLKATDSFEKLDASGNKVGGLTAIVTGLGKSLGDAVKVFIDFAAGIAKVVRGFLDLVSAGEKLIPSVKQLTQLFVLYITYCLSLRVAVVAVGLAVGIYNAVMAIAATRSFAAASGAIAADIAFARQALSANRAAVAANILAFALVLLVNQYMNARDAARTLEAYYAKSEGDIRRKAEETRAQTIERQRETEVSSFKKANDEKFQLLNQYVARLRIFVTRFSEDVKRVDRIGVDALRKDFSELIKFVEDGAVTLQQFQDQTVKNIEGSLKKIHEIQARASGREAEAKLVDSREVDRIVRVGAVIDDIKSNLQSFTGINFGRILSQPLRVDTVDRNLRVHVKTFQDVGAAYERLIELSKKGLERDPTNTESVELKNLREQISKIPLISPAVMDEARRHYDEIDKLLTSQIEKMTSAIKAQERLIRELRGRGEQREFDNSIVDKDVLQTIDTVADRLRALRDEAAVFELFGNTEDARKKLEEVDRLIEGQIQKLASALKAQEKLVAESRASTDRRKFTRDTSELDVLKVTGLLLERTNQLESAAVRLYQSGNLEDARKKFEEINSLLDSQYEKLNSARKAQEKLIADLGVKSEQRAFERSLIGRGNVEATVLTLERVKKLKAEANDLFNRDQLEEARRKFEEIDSLLQKIFDRQKSFREKAAKLGVVFSTPLVGAGVDKAINENEANRLALERRRLRDLTAQQRQVGASRDRNDSVVGGLEDRRLGELGRELDAARADQRGQDATRLAFEQRTLNQLQQNRLGLERQLADVTRERIGLEKLFVAQQKLRYEAALEAEKALKQLAAEALALNQARTKNEQDLAKLATERANAQKLQLDSFSALRTRANELETELKGIERPLATLDPQDPKLKTFHQSEHVKAVLAEYQNILNEIEKTADPTAKIRKIHEAMEKLGQLRNELVGLRGASIGLHPDIKNFPDRPRRGQDDAGTLAGLARRNPEFAARLAEVDRDIGAQRARLNAIVQGQADERFANREIDELKKKNDELQKQLEDAARRGNAGLDALGADNPFIKAEPGIRRVQDGINERFDGTVQRLNNILGLMERMGNLQQNVPGATPAPAGPPLPGRAGGGQFRTDDTVGLFNKDEFVVNASASQRFAPQLRSINMGFEPSGSKSNPNINVGDVNVTLQSSGSAQVDARAVGDAIRREIRRGTLKL